MRLKLDAANRDIYYDFYFQIVPTFINSDISVSTYFAVVSSVLVDLQFVTCAHRGYEGLQFIELLNIFDACTWFLLVTLLCAITLIFPQFQETSSQAGLVPIKVLLEQGNPCPTSLISNHRCTWISGTVLLMGIILSNSYKNKNVYNMIIPMKIVPYRRLQELVDDNFTIHTRSKHVSIYNNMLLAILNNKSDTASLLIAKHVTSHTRVYSIEFATYGRGLISHSSETNDLYNRAMLSKMNTNLTELLQNATSLMPLSDSFVRGFIVRIKAVLRIGATDTTYLEQFLQEEMHQLQNALRRCTGSAVVLPTYLALRFIKNMERKGYTSVYRGSETYLDMSLAFDVHGPMPLYFFQRTKYAQRCGLWMWWENLFKKKFVRKIKSKGVKLKSPGMDGNVIIIFLLLASGLIFSFACVCLECVFKTSLIHTIVHCFT